MDIYHDLMSITRWFYGKKQIFHLILTIMSVFLFLTMIAPPILSTNTNIQNNKFKIIEVITNTLQKPTQIDMLLFLSPQYQNDSEILFSINNYIATVKQDVNWTVKIIPILNKQNQYNTIDKIIEQHYYNDTIKACLMVGEDLNTASSGQYMNMEKPSIMPWATLGGNKSYETKNQHIISKTYTIDIFISLLYPNQYLSYETKKTQIINTFNTFSNQRKHTDKSSISILESRSKDTQSTDFYKTMFNQSTVQHMENPSKIKLAISTQKTHTMYFVRGHSNPSETILNEQENTRFTSKHLKSLNTPLFAADGCYVNGYWINQNNTNQKSSYGNIVCENQNIHIMILGLISQKEKSTQQTQNTINDILSGKTITSTFLNSTTMGDLVFYGDPTFHYSS